MKPPEIHVDELALLTSSYTAGALTSVRTPDDVELSREFWDIALEEVAVPFPFKNLGEWMLEPAEMGETFSDVFMHLGTSSPSGLLCLKMGEAFDVSVSICREMQLPSGQNGEWTQLAFEAEVLPYFLSLALWGDRLRGCMLLVSLTMKQPDTAESVAMQMLCWHAT